MKTINLSFSILCVVLGLQDQIYTAQTLNEQLWSAVIAGQLQTVQSLLVQGANVDCQNEIIESTPLLLACAAGHSDVAQALLAAGANAHHRDWCGQTAMFYACCKAHIDIVRLLLDHGVDINCVYDVDDDDYYGAGELTALNIVLDPFRALTALKKLEAFNIAILLLDRGARLDQKSIEQILCCKQDAPNSFRLLYAKMALNIAKIDATSVEQDLKYIVSLENPQNEGETSEQYQHRLDQVSQEYLQTNEPNSFKEQIEFEKSWAHDFKKEFAQYIDNQPNKLADFVFNSSKYSEKRNFTSQVIAALRKSVKSCNPLLGELADTPVRRKIAFQIKQQIHQSEMENCKRDEEQITQESLLFYTPEKQNEFQKIRKELRQELLLEQRLINEDID